MANRENGESFPAFSPAFGHLMLFASLGVALVYGQFAAADEVRIAHYDPLHALTITPSTDPTVSSKTNLTSTATISFEALGRSFIIDVVRNDRLIANLGSRISVLNDQLRIYKGTVRGVPGSWARLSEDINRVSGIVWDGAEFFLIDQLGLLKGDEFVAGINDQLVAVRLVDIELQINDFAQSGRMARLANAADLLHEATGLVQKKLLAKSLTARAMTLGIVTDTTFADRYSDPERAALFRLNVADGIFTEQVDIHLNLEHILNVDGMSDPFTSTVPEELLATLAEVKSSTPELASLGLAHLLTAHDLDGLTRGLAVLSSACGSSAGIGLTRARSGVIDGLIMAHEFGHNFGAPHDNEEGSACESTPDGFIMSPTINSSAVFSDCSLAEMSDFLSTVSCITPVPSAEIRLDVPTLPTQLLYKDRFEFDVVVSNIGLESVVDSELAVIGNDAFQPSFVHPPNRRCNNVSGATEQVCDLDNFYPGEVEVIPTNVVPIATGTQTLDFLLTASNDTDPSNNSSSHVFEVLPATEASVGLGNIGSLAIGKGGVVTFRLIVFNGGDFDVFADVVVQTEPNHSLSSTANCISPQPGRLDCDIGLVPAGARLEFELRVDSDPDVDLELTESLNQSIAATLSISLPNTNETPDSTNFFIVYGAIFDVETEFTNAPRTILQGETVDFVANIVNFGPDPVPEFEINIAAPRGVEVGTPLADGGICDSDGQLATCTVEQLDPDSSMSISIPYTGKEPGNSTAVLRVLFPFGKELDSLQPAAFSDFEVVPLVPPPPPPPPPAPPSGGGITSLCWLVLLLSIVSRRAVLRRRKIRLSTY